MYFVLESCRANFPTKSADNFADSFEGCYQPCKTEERGFKTVWKFRWAKFGNNHWVFSIVNYEQYHAAFNLRLSRLCCWCFVQYILGMFMKMKMKWSLRIVKKSELFWKKKMQWSVRIVKKSKLFLEKNILSKQYNVQ